MAIDSYSEYVLNPNQSNVVGTLRNWLQINLLLNIAEKTQ